MRHDAGPVLITGCSSGIGRAAALKLVRAGHVVYATARRPETLEELRVHGCRTLRLDLTDDDSMIRAVSTVEAAHQRVGTLVNNAGYAEIGPAESLSQDRLRRQFETNVLGPHRLCQLVLPGMREAGTGRIVNVTSIGERCVFPLWGSYAASKHALKALTDALRMEAACHGVTVVRVVPGLISTNFAAAIDRNITEYAYDEEASRLRDPYATHVAGFRSTLRQVLGDDRASARCAALKRISQDPEVAAKTITRAVTAARPRTRYLVPAHARLAITSRLVLPDLRWDALMRAVFLGRPKGAGSADPEPPAGRAPTRSSRAGR